MEFFRKMWLFNFFKKPLGGVNETFSRADKRALFDDECRPFPLLLLCVCVSVWVCGTCSTCTVWSQRGNISLCWQETQPPRPSLRPRWVCDVPNGAFVIWRVHLKQTTWDTFLCVWSTVTLKLVQTCQLEPWALPFYFCLRATRPIRLLHSHLWGSLSRLAQEQIKMFWFKCQIKSRVRCCCHAFLQLGSDHKLKGGTKMCQRLNLISKHKDKIRFRCACRRERSEALWTPQVRHKQQQELQEWETVLL